MLNYADNLSIENLKIKLTQGGTGAKYTNVGELDSIARNAITEYHVNIQGVKEQFMGNVIEIDGNKSKKKIVEEMARLLTLKDSNAPRKPPKIIMMGPPGVDLREHASTLSGKYKLIYIDSDQLVKDFIRREGEQAHDLRQVLKNGDMIPDDHVIRCLRERLEMPDCKTNGWILQGAPTTVDQIGMLKELNLQPSLVITLDMSDHLIYEKLEQRRFDPVTNKYHYILSENVRDEAILARL
jgi:adenylate kinase